MEILGLFFARSNDMQTYWNYYLTIVLALLAFFGSGRRSRILAGLVTVTFLGFAWWNLRGISGIAQQRVELCTYLAGTKCTGEPVPVTILTDANTLMSPLGLLTITLKPPSPDMAFWVHLVADGFVICAIWILTIRHPAHE